LPGVVKHPPAAPFGSRSEIVVTSYWMKRISPLFLERETGFEPATSSLGIQTYFKSKSLARFCRDFLNLQHLAESAFSEPVIPNEAQMRQVFQQRTGGHVHRVPGSRYSETEEKFLSHPVGIKIDVGERMSVARQKLPDRKRVRRIAGTKHHDVALSRFLKRNPPGQKGFHVPGKLTGFVGGNRPLLSRHYRQNPGRSGKRHKKRLAIFESRV
jgi:hypothetical protein